MGRFLRMEQRPNLIKAVTKKFKHTLENKKNSLQL